MAGPPRTTGAGRLAEWPRKKEPDHTMRKRNQVLDMEIDMDAVAAAVSAAVVSEQPERWTPQVGEKVIHWGWEATLPWGGPGEHGGEQLVIGATTSVLCSPDRCAPADTPLADPKDPRLVVRKGKKPGAWLAGDWVLELPGRTATWHKTKRNATAAGRRRLAILDFHAARAAEGGSGS